MRRTRGFTLVEVAVTLAIIAVLTAMAYSSLSLQKRRAGLAGATSELHALLRGARQNALATGRDTIVMVFPDAANPERGVGRFIVYVDTSTTGFFGATPPNFATWNAQTSVYSDNLLGTINLPAGVRVRLTGNAPTLQAPYDAITAAACSFCATTTDKRGAIVFDPRGRARFYGSGTGPLAVSGGTLALESDDIKGYRLVIVAAGTGVVRVINNG